MERTWNEPVTKVERVYNEGRSGQKAIFDQTGTSSQPGFVKNILMLVK